MNAIREKRRAAGLTQKALAEAVGVHEVTIQRWEHGKCTPEAYIRNVLCRVLQCSPAELGFEPEAPILQGLTAEEARQKRSNWERAREYAHRRLELGWSQPQLAQRAGVNVSQVKDLELGRAWPHWETRQKIRRALSLPEERYCSTEKRNALFLELQSGIRAIVWHNMHRIRAVRMDPEDAFQELALCALRAIDRFKPDEGAGDLRAFVNENARFTLKRMLTRAYRHGLSGRIDFPLPTFNICSLDAMLEAKFQFEDREDWDEDFMYGHEENRPW